MKMIRSDTAIGAPQWKAIWLALAFLLAPGQAPAETLVLVQGFLGDAGRWRDSGITYSLEQAGWRDAGHLSLAGGAVIADTPLAPASRRFYTIELATYAPLMVQAKALDRYIDHIRSLHPYSGLVLAGHSAGGVLARLYMVQHDEDAFAALITIASPHLGSRSAEVGIEVGERALGWMADLFGREALDFQWGLIRDLRVERPHNLLGWLNHQPHPPALYIAIVRGSRGHDDPAGNLLVPAWSQDMNHVYALRGRARAVRVPRGHGLSAADGRLLARILEQLRHV